MKATDELINEHQGIELMLKILNRVAELYQAGKSIPDGHMEGILSFLSIFVDKCHHGKEEEYLFPALEAAGIPNKNGPIGVMLMEHQQGRQLVARLKTVLTAHGTSKDSSGPSSIQEIVHEYTNLLTQHIAKENEVLFPMADAKLSIEKDELLFEAFQKLEQERIGKGRHEKFHVLLNQLKDAYLTPNK